MRAAGSRVSLLLWAAAALGSVSVVVVPVRLAALHGFPGEQALVAAAGSAFVRVGAQGGSAAGLALEDMVSFWREFHVVKAGLALLVLITLVMLASSLGRTARTAHAGDRGRAAPTRC